VNWAFLLGHLSDPHITEAGRLVGGRFDTAPYLAAAIDALNALDPRPDVVLATGDLVDRGQRTEYERLRSYLDALEMPFLLLPGNHDERSALRAAFPEQPWSREGTTLHYVVDDYPVRIVALDSAVAGHYEGHVGPEQLAWLDGLLTDDGQRATIVAVHHPPFITGIEHMDQMGLIDRDALGAVIARHRQVVAVLSGHLHRPITTRWAATVAMTIPGVAHQVALDLRPSSHPELLLEPAYIALHLWNPDRGLVSHLSRVPPPGGVSEPGASG
jgi:3',5'-cyclic AMP phosphodiesterase CpdA